MPFLPLFAWNKFVACLLQINELKTVKQNGLYGFHVAQVIPQCTFKQSTTNQIMYLSYKVTLVHFNIRFSWVCSIVIGVPIFRYQSESTSIHVNKDWRQDF